MAELSVESNGMLEKTAVYFNGSQIAGIKELLLSLDEDGTFDAMIQYTGIDKQLYTKQIFEDYLTNIQTVEPSFTEEEAQTLKLFTIESDGDIENTTLYLNDEQLDGVINVYLHIKTDKNKSGLLTFLKKDTYDTQVSFKAEITFRNEDDSIETEEVF